MSETKKQAFNGYFNLPFPSVNSFREARDLYNSIKPLRGPRGHLDIRPVGPRRHTRFQIHKISDTEYSLTATYALALRYIKAMAQRNVSLPPEHWVRARQMVSFHKNGQLHIHCPVGIRYVRGDYSGVWGAGVKGATNQIWNFLSQTLPAGMWVETEGRWRSKKKTYLAIDTPSGTTYYLLSPLKDTYILRLHRRNGIWRPINPLQEYSQVIPRELSLKVRRTTKAFWLYVEHYFDLMLASAWPPNPWPRGVSDFRSIFEMMDSDPWNAMIELLRHNPAKADEFIQYWKVAFKQGLYRGLADNEWEYNPVPLGKKCRFDQHGYEWPRS